MIPQKIWNLGPLKSLEILPILSIIGNKKAHNFSQLFPVCFYFLHKIHMTLTKLATKDKIMIVGSTFSSSMSRYGSAGNANLLVLPVTFFLSEIDDSVTRFYFYYIFIKYTMFLKFFGKIIDRSGPDQYQSRKRCHITRGCIHHFGPMWLASNAAPCWQREQSARTFTARSKNHDLSKFRIRDPSIKTFKIRNPWSIS